MAEFILGHIGDGNVFLQNRRVPNPFGVAVRQNEFIIRHSEEFVF